ncbi:MAG: 2TM domain-containing protein [Chloroflexi bacterium]|nr:2TM domain-containing protein [Chloroflexota bacterium]MXX84593.1 2TM domain-containing protein [Chloroflexota bacterium]MYA93088.1 2TM domain-containing protein [Chloroflexota bacterium]MYC55776.1 2TM domain-containing protein [Chloroflexota bacterium]MYD37339.1 2TM domain-containing protein [Chloroflexota bacterium]
MRQRAEKKLSARRELTQHLLSYVLVNLFLWIIFFATWRGFPWPLFVTAGWGIGLVSHLADYYFKHGRGAERREAAIDREVSRQRRLAQERGELLDDDDYDEDYEEARALDLSRGDAGQLRLRDDGELVDESEYLREQTPADLGEPRSKAIASNCFSPQRRRGHGG